jgi:hypothetical protein
MAHRLRKGFVTNPEHTSFLDEEGTPSGWRCTMVEIPFPAMESKKAFTFLSLAAKKKKKTSNPALSSP